MQEKKDPGPISIPSKRRGDEGTDVFSFVNSRGVERLRIEFSTLNDSKGTEGKIYTYDHRGKPGPIIVIWDVDK